MFARSLFDRLQEEFDKAQRASAVAKQSSLFKRWMNFGEPAPGMARAMNPVGAEYLQDRIADDTLRPSNWFDSLVKRVEEGQAQSQIRREQQQREIDAFNLERERIEQQEMAPVLGPQRPPVQYQPNTTQEMMLEEQYGNASPGFLAQPPLLGFTQSALPEPILEAAGNVPVIGPGLEPSLRGLTSPLGAATAGAGTLGPTARSVSGGLLPSLGIDLAGEAGYVGTRSGTEYLPDFPGAGVLREGLPIAAGIGAGVAAPSAARAGARTAIRNLPEPPGGLVPVHALNEPPEIPQFRPSMRPVGEAAEGATPRVDLAEAAPPPSVPPSVAPDEVLRPQELDPVARLTELLKEAKPVRGRTRSLQAAERGRRAGSFEAVRSQLINEGVPAREAFQRARRQLAGKLPSAEFEPVEAGLTHDQINDLFLRIDRTPQKPFTKNRISDALNQVLSGEVPTRSDIKLLEDTFGKELAAEVLKKRGFTKNLWENLLGVGGLWRAVRASFDISAPLRQGAMLVGHPKEFSRAFKAQLKALLSEDYALNLNRSLDEGFTLNGRPWGEVNDAAGLYRSPLEATAELAEREEAFMTNLADNIPILRPFERAYVTFLNKLRTDTFKTYVNTLEKLGRNTPEDEEAFARFVNFASGRGDLSAVNEFVPVLNQGMFSARLLASRVQAPAQLFFTTPEVRKIVARDLAAFLGYGIGLMSLAKAGGEAYEATTGNDSPVNIELDPRSVDFGKIQVGNERLDFWTGFQPLARYAAQLLTGERKTSTGNLIPQDRSDTFWRFWRSKLSPLAGLGVDISKGETFLGEQFPPSERGDIIRQLQENLMPFFLTDLKEAIELEGARGGLLALPGAVGASVLTYQTQTERIREARERVFVEGKAQGKWDYESLEDVDAVTLSEIDQDFRVQDILNESTNTSPESEAFNEAERLVTDFKDTQRQRDQNYGDFFRAIADGEEGGMDPVTWRDELQDAQAELWARRDQELKDIEFPETDAPTNEIDRAIDRYFEVEFSEFKDASTGEVDWDGYFSARDQALSRLSASDKTETLNWIKRNFETPLVTELREIADAIDTVENRRGQTYFDLEAGSARTDFRIQNPGVDAALFLTGTGPKTLRTRRAADLVVDWLSEHGVSIETRDITRMFLR